MKKIGGKFQNKIIQWSYEKPEFNKKMVELKKSMDILGEKIQKPPKKR